MDFFYDYNNEFKSCCPVPDRYMMVISSLSSMIITRYHCKTQLWIMISNNDVALGSVPITQPRRPCTPKWRTNQHQIDPSPSTKAKEFNTPSELTPWLKTNPSISTSLSHIWNILYLSVIQSDCPLFKNEIFHYGSTFSVFFFFFPTEYHFDIQEIRNIKKRSVIKYSVTRI